jgi:hypothetical protein
VETNWPIRNRIGQLIFIPDRNASRLTWCGILGRWFTGPESDRSLDRDSCSAAIAQPTGCPLPNL